MEKNTVGVAFFDSGIGGLTVMAECVKYLRAHTAHTPTFYYYGDNATRRMETCPWQQSKNTPLRHLNVFPP